MTTSPANTRPATTRKWLTCDGQQFRKLILAGHHWLEAHYEHVNALNVFPVPDGDTGTNMLLTIRSASRRIQDSDETHVGQVAQEVAQGALMGARGNSGVILSQILRGLAQALRDAPILDAPLLARGLAQAATTAYGGVMKPVEGTILTVIRLGANECEEAVTKSNDLRFVLERVLERMEMALAHTPEQLPILKQAGVVDSGGQGLVYFLAGMLRYVHGEIDITSEAAPATMPTATPAQALAMPESGELEFPYDVQFILMGQGLDVNSVRNRIDAMGDSTVVVGDERTIKVHIHVKDPGEPLTYGISLGHVTDVVVENMQMQMEDIVGEVAPPPPVQEAAVEPGQIGVIAVASGAGLAAILHSLGVHFIVDGGQTNNPSTEEIFQAIQDVPTDKIVILPNNKNIILASEAARDLSPKEVAVVATRTLPQGIGAMLGYTPDGELAGVAAAMERAAGEVATGEITIATRSVTIDGVAVAEGAYIGLYNGRLVAAESGLTEVVKATLEAMDMAEHELAALYYGEAVTEADAMDLAGQIEALYPDAEVEVHAGGQPHYHYVIGAE